MKSKTELISTITLLSSMATKAALMMMMNSIWMKKVLWIVMKREKCTKEEKTRQPKSTILSLALTPSIPLISIILTRVPTINLLIAV